jgi:hypothetical protein
MSRSDMGNSPYSTLSNPRLSNDFWKWILARPCGTRGINAGAFKRFIHIATDDDLRGNMKKYMMLTLLPLVAACSGGGTTGGTTATPQTGQALTVRTTPMGAVVTKDAGYNDVVAVYNAAGDTPSTVNKTLPGLSNGVDVLAQQGVNRWETEVERTVVASIAANGHKITRDRISGIDGAMVETYRLYDPNDALVAIETRGSNAATAAVVGSVGYWGQWNGEVDGVNYEEGAVNIVVNGSTGQADLIVYDPTSAQTFINEASGSNTLTYDAASQQVTGSVVFTTATQSASGEALLSLAGSTAVAGSTSAPELITGHAYTDANQPFGANIGMIGALDN